jgi:CHAT domain-containing protein/tetratricopeptide (TPR) repeat protein
MRAFCLPIVLAITALTLRAQDGATERELRRGAAVVAELAGGQVHTYRIRLAAEQFLQVVVEQQGIDLALAASAPDGRRLIEIDRWEGTRGRERASVLAGTSGTYHLIVRPINKDARAGRYAIAVDVLRTAAPEDGAQVAAEALFAEARQLHRQATAGPWRRAVSLYEASLPTWRAIGDRLTEAATLHNLAELHKSLNDFPKALQTYEQALALRRSENDRQGQAATLGNIGEVYYLMGEWRTALDYFLQAVPHWRGAQDLQGEATALNDIGVIYGSLGEYQKALDYHLQALPVRRAIGDRAGEARSLNNLGMIYRFLDENQKALDYYAESLPLRRLVGDKRGEATTLNNIAAVYESLEDFPKALDFYNQSLAIKREVGDRRSAATTLNNIGEAYYTLGQNEKALELYAEALEIHQALGNRSGEATTLGNVAASYGALGDHARGIRDYQRALALTREIGDRKSEMLNLVGIARLEGERGNVADAYRAARSAIAIVESLRAAIAEPGFRASYLASNQKPYELSIDLLMRMHARSPSEGFAAQAFEMSERARARSLLDMLAEVNADIREGVDPALLERERRVQQRLSAKEQEQVQLLSGTHTNEQADAAHREVEALLTEYQATQAELRQKSPRYAALTHPQPLSLREIQERVLDGDTLLLEYSLGATRSYLWAVTATTMTSVELPDRGTIEKAARRAHELLMVSHQRANRRPAELALADLSRIVLGPIAGQLGNKRLLIVAEGALLYVPFAALYTPNRENVRTPLIAEHEILNVPSASVAALQRQEFAGRQVATNTVAVLADPVLQRNDPRVPRARTVNGTQAALVNGLLRAGRASDTVTFERLPFTRQEADTIAALARPDQTMKALDFAASRATVTAGGLDRYQIVHFATHGVLNADHPELSGVVLSLVDEQGNPQDGFLRVHEIFNLKLRAELVVLSACRTALGKEVKGEGLVGLVRGFMYAGARGVVASVWDVRDEATAALMKRFYTAMLRDGLKPAAALRAAQVAMWRDRRWEAPYFWAAFVLQGDGS